jgi:hypothetical protein
VEPLDTNARNRRSFAAPDRVRVASTWAFPPPAASGALVGDPLLENRAVNAKSQ